jgi:hypothetical protein
MTKLRWVHLGATQLRRVPVVYVAVSLAGCLVVSGLAARQNNLQMIELRNRVYQVDEAGGDVAGALRDLQLHVVNHMNTGLARGENSVYPPIQLKYTYQRLVAAEQQRVDAANTAIYTQAQIHCERQNSVDVSGRNRVPCIQQYVQDKGVKARTIPASLYQFDFVAAKWSPDLAGLSLAVAVCLTMLLLMRVALIIARR